MAGEDPRKAHSSDDELAAYLAHRLRGPELRRVEEHLALCRDCRQEVIDAEEILKTPRRRSWPVLVPLAAAAAGVLLFFSWPPNGQVPSAGPVHREVPAAASSPVPIAPIGSADGIQELVWTRVPGADRYRVTLYDENGSALWRETTSDSVQSLPDSVVLSPDRPYFWAVEARIGWDVWESSVLVEFRLGGHDSNGSDGGVSR